VARKASPARLVIALSVAALLAIFLLYTSIAGGSRPVLQPSKLAGHRDVVTLGGVVVAPVRGSAEGGYRFRLRDVKGTKTVPVVYRDSLPDLFKAGREISVDGRLSAGTFVGRPDSMVTKCPSKYSAKSPS
jgi:cytochrome c-type biogenesis protein CcmE